MVKAWTPQAAAELRKAYDYISKDSPQNVRKVVDEQTHIADRLPAQPEMFPADKFKKNNNGSWRAFEKFHYRILKGNKFSTCFAFDSSSKLSK
jgi:hypothetical protein